MKLSYSWWAREMGAGKKWGVLGSRSGRKRYLAENTADVDGGNKESEA